MQLLEHYARLYELWKERKEGSSSGVEVTVPELAAWFHCTERNAKLLVQAMRKQCWIEWQSGLGRGHRSKLFCSAHPDDLLVEQAELLLAAGDVQGAVDLLQATILTEHGRMMLLQVIQQSFGFWRNNGETRGRRRDVLRFPSYRQPGSLDPAYATRRSELHWIRQLFDTLVVYDEERQTYLPGLAYHWESDSAARVWRFYLQKQVQFHNGEAFTASDVQYTLERLASLDTAKESYNTSSPYAALFTGIERMTPIHDHLIEIRFKDSCYPLLSLLSMTAASIVPSRSSSELAYLPVGTGPFMLQRRDERVLVLKANPFYYGRGTNLDQVEMWYLPEIYERETIQSAEVRESEGMNFWHYGGSQKSEALYDQLECLDRGCKYVLMNQAKEGPLQYREIRDRIYEVIRQGSAMTQLGGNRGELADGFVRGLRLRLKERQAGSSKTEEERVTVIHPQRLSHDEVASDQNGLSVSSVQIDAMPTLQLVTYAGAGHERDAEWLQQELMKQGLSLMIRILPYETLSQESILEGADLMLLEQPVDADEEGAMWTILASDQSPWRQCLPPGRLPELDLRLAELFLEPSRSERLRSLAQLEQEMMEERSVVLWYRWRQMASFPSELQGVRISPLGWVDYKELWFKE